MKLVSLISGGIDSPVAAHMMHERGAEIVLLHMDNQPFTDEGQLNKAVALAEHLASLFNSDLKLYIAPHGPSQTEFARSCRRSLQCLLCKRMMLRAGAIVAQAEGADALVTGESLGQVASQTLQNINAEMQALSAFAPKIQVLRPLIGFDKIEIEAYAKKIGTYEISIRPGVCCTIVPDKPSTAAQIGAVLAEEAKTDVAALADACVRSAEIRLIKPRAGGGAYNRA